MEAKSADGKERNSSSKLGRRLIKIVGNVFFAILLLVIALLVFFLVQNKVSGGTPRVAGRQMYIVLSGSMNPTFDTGSLTLVRPVSPEQIKLGDIITYRSVASSESLTTHRVVEIDSSEPGNPRFITRGDANEINDPNPVTGQYIIGKVDLAIPYLGYLMSFGQTKKGLLVLVIVPGVLLILSEAFNLYNYISKSKKEESIGKKSEA